MNQVTGKYSPNLNTSRRPASIAELADRARDQLHWDERGDLKHYLRIADRYRKDGKDVVKHGDLEMGFVLLANSATLILEKIPTHPEYETRLTSYQRNNLALNGQQVLEDLSELKSALVDRFDKWLQNHPVGLANPYEHKSGQERIHTPSGQKILYLNDGRDTSIPSRHVLGQSDSARIPQAGPPETTLNAVLHSDGSDLLQSFSEAATGDRNPAVIYPNHMDDKISPAVVLRGNDGAASPIVASGSLQRLETLLDSVLATLVLIKGSGTEPSQFPPHTREVLSAINKLADVGTCCTSNCRHNSTTYSYRPS